MTLHGKFVGWCCGNVAAANFLVELWDAAQSWDDLKDEGRCDSPDKLLAWLAFGKEYDPFFSAYAVLLRPVLMSMYLDWQAANALEAEPTPARLAKSYGLRAGFYRMVHLTVYICGGHDHAIKVAREIWDEYGETPEDLEREFSEKESPDA